jgi:biopolymer transport protein ExbD
MSLLKKKKGRSAEVPNASLADIAFLILIFFMVATTIDIDKGIPMLLPAEGETTEVAKDRITNILIDPNGAVLMDNREIDIAEIKGLVQEKVLQNPKMIFSVKTHPRTQYQTYVKVLDQLRMGKARIISIAE